MEQQPPHRSSKPTPKPDNTYAKISGITFELLGINLAIIGLGYYLHDLSGENIPWILLGSIFLSVAATIFYLLKKFVK